MAPSHANKAGRRYRYYISTPKEEADSGSATGWRLPATEIEAVVLNGLTSFLEDKLRLMSYLDMGECSPGDLQCLLRNAATLAQRLADAGPSGQRGILLELIDHIQVGENLVRIFFNKRALHALVGDPIKDKERRKHREDLDDAFALDLEVAFKKRGAGMKLILCDDHQQSPTSLIRHFQGDLWFHGVHTQIHRH